MIADYYVPRPQVLILDFGSDEIFASEMDRVCKENGYRYEFIPDYDTYSPAIAHNRGFEFVETDFVFFCDADFFGFREIFADLATAATNLRMRDVVDIIINPPAYHLNEPQTQAFAAAATHEERSSELRRIAYHANFQEFNKDANFFVAPYSNVYLINRHMYSMSGGYDERFRGHGSEDFEFLVRLAMHTAQLPMPERVSDDLYGPTKPTYFSHKPYAGFRRLLELMSHPSANMGFKIFHLWHPRDKEIEWYAASDWRRDRFNEAVAVYKNDDHRLLGIDFLQRVGRMACVCKHKDHWGYFVPLRVAGYETVPFFDDSAESVAAISKGILSGDFDGIAIFNPYMKSHSRFLETVLLARQLDKKVIVVERGALPSTIYYDSDVAYASPHFSEEALKAEIFSKDELAAADDYITSLRRGDRTLEAMDSYGATADRRLALSELKGTKCFIPLQLDDDMAVTMFKRGQQDYNGFLQALPRLIEDNPDILFVVKPHPLSNIEFSGMNPNVIIAERNDNIHYLLDVCDFTLCYNSGVGLLSMLHGKPTITLGNAFYNMEGSGFNAASAAAGIDAFRAGEVSNVSRHLATRLAAWFLFRKYSDFTAIDDLKDFALRKAHAYKEILVTKLRLDGRTYCLDRVKRHAPFSWSSHASAAISIAVRQRGTGELQGAHSDFHLGKYLQAASLYERAYERNPSRPNLLRFAAEARYRSGDRKKALEHLRQAVQLSPKVKRARLRLLTVKYPWLAGILGDFSMTIPKE
jgi:predicted glycosyltransferase involved in capsule biosynthesis/capsule polysaccharide modification protein KpsS